MGPSRTPADEPSGPRRVPRGATAARRWWPMAGVLTAVLVLTSCGSAAPAPGPGDPGAALAALAELNRHGAADVEFAHGMLPHHRQGVELAELARAHGATAPVRDLALRIYLVQGPEADQLTGYLTAWGLPATTDMRMTGMTGMADPRTVERLRGARGAAFDELWLRTMIDHHRGAVAMARAELAAGVNPGARNFAENVVSVQEREIGVMNTLLGPAGG